MPLDPGTAGTRCRAAYPLLLGIQAVAAALLFLTIFTLFQQIVSQIGQARPLDTSTTVAAIVLALVMQACYWARYLRVPVPAPFRSAFGGHLLMFASRVSFFFGGALFTAIFFRHVPQLDVLPPLGQGVAKTLGVMGLLLAAFCFSLELERLGRAIEEGPARD